MQIHTQLLYMSIIAYYYRRHPYYTTAVPYIVAGKRMYHPGTILAYNLRTDGDEAIQLFCSQRLLHNVHLKQRLLYTTAG